MQIFGIRNLGILKQLPPPQLLPHPLSQAGAHPQSLTTGAHPQLSTTGAHAGAAHDGAQESQPIGAAHEGIAGAHPPQAEEPQVSHDEIGAAGAQPPHAEEPHVSQAATGAAQGAAHEGAANPHPPPQTSAGAAQVGAQPPSLPHPKSPASALFAKQHTASAAAIEKNFILVSWVDFEREVVFRKLCINKNPTFIRKGVTQETFSAMARKTR